MKDFSVIIHLMIEIIITLFALIKDSHCVPVAVLNKVIWHREHDSYFLHSLLCIILQDMKGAMKGDRGMAQPPLSMNILVIETREELMNRGNIHLYLDG